MNLLFDFLTAHRKSGAGEYQRRVFYEMMNNISCAEQQIDVFALYDSSLGIAYEDLQEESIRARYGITFLDCNGRSITELVCKNKIDRFFIACSQSFKNRYELKELKCEVICVTHDLCFEENYRDKIYLYLDMIEPGADSPAKLYRLGRFRNNWLVKKIFDRFDVFSWKYIRESGNDAYKQDLDNMKPVIEMYHNNPNVKMIVVSDYSKFSLSYSYGVSCSDIKVLYSPERVAATADHIENDELRDIIFQKKKYYLMVSTDRKEKNPHKAISAFSRYSQLHPDSFLVTLGYGEQKFPNHISLPFLSDADLSAAYANCYALLYPSFFEGFGYPPIEAMHYGKPVLCSNTTSMPEVLQDAAIFFSPLYESAIFSALSKLTDDNYAIYRDKSVSRYYILKQRQERDLNTLLSMLLN